MAKKKSPINTNNKREMELIKALVNTEHYITEEQFLEIGNKSIMSRWQRSGYIQEVKDGLYSTTEAFFRECRHKTTPAIKTSGSGSPEHSEGIVNAIRLLPSLPFQDDKGERLIQNSQEIKDDFKDYRKENYTDYLAKDSEIRQEWFRQLQSAQDAYIRAMAAKDSKAIAEAYKALQRAERLYQRAEDTNKQIVSTPDLTVRMDAHELREYAQNLREHQAEMTHYRVREQYEKAIQRVEQISRSITTGQRVEIAIEITTEHYTPVDVAMHEAYTEFTGTEVIFVPIR